MPQSNNTLFKRKFRWTFEGSFPAGDIPCAFIRLSNRPHWEISEPPMPPTTQHITTTFWDIDTQNEALHPLYKVLAECYEAISKLREGAPIPPYKGRGKVTLFDGAGNRLEEFVLEEMFPIAVNWGDLSWGDESVELEVTWSCKCVHWENYIPLNDGVSQINVFSQLPVISIVPI